MTLFTTFRFEIVLILDDPRDGISNPVCEAAFAQCDGLEMSMEPKTYREGGNNQQQIQLKGPVTYSQLTLRRGMTENFHLWKWFDFASKPGTKATAHGEITLWNSAGEPRMTFQLKECLPVKLRAPSLDSKSDEIAIEELSLVYRQLSLKA